MPGLEVGPGRPGGRPQIIMQEQTGPPAWSPAGAGLGAGHPPDAAMHNKRQNLSKSEQSVNTNFFEALELLKSKITELEKSSIHI